MARRLVLLAILPLALVLGLSVVLIGGDGCEDGASANPGTLSPEAERAIPHDIAILKEVFAVPEPETGTVSPDRPLYNRVNRFWQSHSIRQMVETLDPDEHAALRPRLHRIHSFYNDASAVYQNSKGSKGIPLA